MVTVLQNRWIKHQPTFKQAQFLVLDADEAFYGGAAGGGKSDALLMAALQYVEVPNYAAILFRRTYTDLALPGALMDRANEWLYSSGARWDDRNKTWHFPSTASLSFGYLETENDKYRYQSAEFQFIGFDELTQFSELQYQYLFSRRRRLEGSQIPTRMRAASNPGGVGHNWVKQRFIIEGEVKQRPFIPARLDDNPYIDQEDYDKSLEKLDPLTRQYLKAGDWFARPPGKKFKREWFDGKILDQAPIGLRMVRYWDMAATEPKPGKDPDWTAGCKMGELDGVFYICDMRRGRATPAGNETLVKNAAISDGPYVEIWMEQEPGSSGLNMIDHYSRVVLVGWTFYGNKTTGSKEARANPLSSAAEAGNVRLVSGDWINDFLDELTSFPDGAHDDQVDSASGAHFALTKAGSVWEVRYGEQEAKKDQARDLSGFLRQPERDFWERR